MKTTPEGAEIDGWKDPAYDSAIVMSRKHVKRLGKEEYKKALKKLFASDAVHHIDLIMNDGAVVRFIR